MNVMPKGSGVPSSPSVRPTTRFGVRPVLAAVALALVAVPFALVLLWIEATRPRLPRADGGPRNGEAGEGDGRAYVNAAGVGVADPADHCSGAHDDQ